MKTIDLYNIKAKKSLGQNFLVDEEILLKISQAVEIEGKNIVEVGPGYGALTEKILQHYPHSLHLVELDTYMIHILEQRLDEGELKLGKTLLTIDNIDVLSYENKGDEMYSVVANIPYYITSPILQHFLYKVENTPSEMLILMQKDVAQKILDADKKKKAKSSVLSLFISKKCDVEYVCSVANTSFSPVPKVESSVLKFITHNRFKDIDDDVFLKFIKKGFCEPRKKLSNNLSKSGYDKQELIGIFNTMGLIEGIRPENLSIGLWIKLFCHIQSKK